MQTLVVDHKHTVQTSENLDQTTVIKTTNALPQSIQEVWVHKEKYQLQHVGDNTVVIPAQLNLQQGEEITVSAFTGNLQAMFEAFEQEWKPRCNDTTLIN